MFVPECWHLAPIWWFVGFEAEGFSGGDFVEGLDRLFVRSGIEEGPHIALIAPDCHCVLDAIDLACFGPEISRSTQGLAEGASCVPPKA